MLGMDGVWCAWGYILSILATILCFVHGIIAWGKGGEELTSEEFKKEVEWVRKEREIEQELP